jgi:prephenate dehydrogenase
LPQASKPDKHVIVIGAAGGMGLWAARRWFAELDDVARVTLCDLEPLGDKARSAMSDAPASVDYVQAEYGRGGLSLTNWCSLNVAGQPAAAAPELSQIDLVALAVPLSAIGSVMDGLKGQLASNAWLIDMASVKVVPLAEMVEKASDGVSVVGTHPLFGITGESISGRTVALVPTQPDEDELVGWLDAGLTKLGANTMNVTAERHDRYMLIAQTMTHFALLAFGDAVTQTLQDGESLEELRQFGTPPYLAMANVTGRVLTQNHRLYASIQQAAGADNIREIFAEAATKLANSFNEGSLDDIEAEIDELADRYGAEELSKSARLSEQMFQAGPFVKGVKDDESGSADS